MHPSHPAPSPSRVIGATFSMLKALASEFGTSDMPAQQVRLLAALYDTSELPQSQLPQVMGVRTTAVSKALHKLSNAPYLAIEYFEDADNRRCNIVRLTPHGRAVMTRAAAAYAPHLTGRPAAAS